MERNFVLLRSSFSDLSDAQYDNAIRKTPQCCTKCLKLSEHRKSWNLSLKVKTERRIESLYQEMNTKPMLARNSQILLCHSGHLNVNKTDLKHTTT